MRQAMLVAVAAVLATTGIVAAQPPTVSDIALCNQEAAAATGGSALPRMPEPRPGLESTHDPAAREGVPAPRESSPSVVTARATREPERRTETGSTGTIVTDAPDPWLEGMAAEKLDDPAYRTAYRDCMQRQLDRPRR
ncbi:MAG: hypothetical protein HYU51_14340 [Candidatus Rokubacteria bacterium]|nr:hypothetical protein [Candidatus Rokubacteria bacterium]